MRKREKIGLCERDKERGRQGMTNLTKLGGLGELGGQHHGAHGLGVVEGGQVGEGQRRALCPVAVEVLEGRKIS